MNRYMTTQNILIAVAGSIVAYKFFLEPRLKMKKLVEKTISGKEPEQAEKVDEKEVEKQIEKMNANDGGATANFFTKTTNKFIKGHYPVTLSNPPRRQDNDSSTYIA